MTVSLDLRLQFPRLASAGVAGAEFQATSRRDVL
jgi:hypothetical protein